MNSTTRGLVIFAVMIAVAVVFCYFIPFVVLTGAGIGVAKAVIQVPGEVLITGGFFGEDFTNTLLATFVADIIVFLFVFLAWRASKGWTQEVPSRFQAWVELLGSTIWGFVKDMAGTGPNIRNLLFPLVATIFIFIWGANYFKLVPTVESIGIMHCAKPEKTGYPRDGAVLVVDRALFVGLAPSDDSYHACEEVLHGHAPEAFDLSAEEETQLAALIEEIDAAEGVATAEQEALYGDLTGFHHPTYYLPLEDLRAGKQPYAFVVTPFFRAPATDLNFTLGLALLSVIFVQYIGVATLGPNYFQKFLNLSALGSIGKRPLGLIDFIAGIFEIISEFAKIISLAFRLFGTMFAGLVLLSVMSFLIGMLLPIPFYFLELIVGLMQAIVFAALTLIFAAQAMVSHHHEEGEEHH